MATFIGTLIIVIFCCLMMGVGLVFTGKPLPGGCGKKVPGAPRCEACPKRRKKMHQNEHPEGASG